MTVVKRKEFINATDETVNAFLSDISAKNVVSTHFAVYGDRGAWDTWTVIFYKDVYQ